MGLFGKGNTMNMIHLEGLPGFGKGYATAMTLDEEHQCLQFKARAFKDTNDVELPLNKITKAGNINITEIEQQSKVGRAVIGGLLFGNAGAIVGAMTAGEKQKIKTLYVINYLSNDVFPLHSLLKKWLLMNNVYFQALMFKLDETVPLEWYHGQ